MQIGDEDHFYRLDSDEQVMKYITGRAFTKSESLEAFHTRLKFGKEYKPLGNFMIFNGENFIGTANLNYIKNTNLVHVGYRIAKEHWGLGYASEVCNSLVEFGFQNGLKQIYGIINPHNNASEKVLTKSGLRVVNGERFYYNDWVKVLCIKKGA